MICRLTRWLISREIDEGGSLPGFARRHLGNCSSCRQEYEVQRSMDAQLLQEAPANDKFPSFLHGRMMAEIRAMEEPAPVRSNSWRWATVAGLLLLAVFICLQLGGPGTTTTPSPEAAAETSQLLAETIPVVEKLSLLDDKVEQAAQSAYNKELENLKSDFQSATDFLLARDE